MIKGWWFSRRVFLLAALACLVGTLLTSPGAAGADVIPQGQKAVSYCFTVANVGDFPDYVVLAYEQPPNPGVPATLHVIADASCFAARFSATFYAMRRAEFSPGLIPTERNAQRTFLASDPRVIQSQGITRVAPVVFVDQRDSRTSIAETYRVVSLTDSAITLERDPIAPGAVNSTTNRALNFAWFALLPLAALIAIGVMLLVRRRRRA
jgi:hypothetical protein